MSGHIFISYKREERAFADRLRKTLARLVPANVWWDEDLQAGGRWSEDIDVALRDAACVVVIWSALSVESDWVMQEASYAKYAGTILPVLKDADAALPVPFREIQTPLLVDWVEGEDHPQVEKVVARARHLVAAHRRRRVRPRLIALALVLVCGLAGSAWAFAAPPSGVTVPLETVSDINAAVSDFRVCAEQEPMFVCRPEAEEMVEAWDNIDGLPER